ncbi:298_t:CDS:2 [Entrophospora sp. SA101]|nr:298_t:CDS:2 [Entrophospora sp. SA101]
MLKFVKWATAKAIKAWPGSDLDAATPHERFCRGIRDRSVLMDSEGVQNVMRSGLLNG